MLRKRVELYAPLVKAVEKIKEENLKKVEIPPADIVALDWIIE